MACVAALTAGTNYAYPLYGPQIADKLGFTLVQSNFIASAGNYGIYLMGAVVGTIVDKKGPKFGVLLAAVLICTGYGLIALTYQGFLINSFLLVALYFFLVGVGAAAAYLSAFSTTVSNFPLKIRGMAVGFPIAAVGLSALCVSALSRWIVDPTDTAGLLWWLSILGGVSNLLCIAGLTKTEAEYEELEPTGILTQIKDKAFILLFITMTVLVGCGLMYITNVGTMISVLLPDASHDHIQIVRGYHVGVIAFFNFISRLLMGAVSDLTGRREWWLGVVAILMSTALFMASFQVKDTSLIVCTSMVGMAYGSAFNIAPTLVSELWGAASAGRNVGLLGAAFGIGAFTFNLLFGAVYDGNSPVDRCTGSPECYGSALRLASLCSFLSLISIIALARRNV